MKPRSVRTASLPEGARSPFPGRALLRLALLVVLAVSLTAALLTACGDASRPAPATEAELSSPGPYAVAVAEFVLVDGSRSTMPNGSYPGAPDRTLRTRIWYPAQSAATAGTPGALPSAPAAGPFPLIGYAHGYTSNRYESPDLKVHLASHGYVVAAPDFPLSNGAAPGGPTIADLANQPGDVAFAMDEVSHPGAELAALAPLAAQVDARRGIAGLSLGGGTTLVAVYHPTLRLDGIQAAVAFAPLSCFFAQDFYSRSLPTLIMAGDSDELVPFDSDPARAFALAPRPVSLIRLRGGNHVGFIGADIPGAENSDVVGCTAVNNAGTGGFSALIDSLTRGTTGDAIDAGNCSGVCTRSFVQTMRAARQVELAKIATLAHFEAVLRKRADAERYLREVFAAQNPDVELSVKD